jgi:hypothetical protein
MKKYLFFLIAVLPAVLFALPAPARDMNAVYDARDAAAAKGTPAKKPSNFQLKNQGNEGKAVGRTGTSNIQENKQPASPATRSGR